MKYGSKAAVKIEKAKRGKRYDITERRRTMKKLRNRTERAKETRRRYRNTPKAKAAEAAYERMYLKTARGKEVLYKKIAKRRILAPYNLNLTSDQWDAIQVNFLHCCAYCGISGVTLEQDHIMPLSRGGQHVYSNIAPACKTCNRKKQAFVPAGCITHAETPQSHQPCNKVHCSA